MRKSLSLTTLALAALLAVGAGCGSTTTSSEDRGTTNTAAETVKEYAVGDEVATGPITHKITSVEKMDTIPSSATLPEWEIIAEDTPADEGFTWLHIKGEVTNNSKEEQTLSSTGVYVIDQDENEFQVSTDTTIYIDSDSTPVYMDIQPTRTATWEGYFEVPNDATKLQIVVNDLAFLPKTEAKINVEL